MDQLNLSPTTSKWGRSRFGGGSTALILISLGLGLVLAAGAGALFAKFGDTEKPWLAFTVMTGAALAPLSAMVWAILVDRLTITGVTKRPEESVENSWYDQAASGTFTDMLLILGVSATFFSIFRFNLNTGLVLAALIVIMMADFGIRYLIKSRRAR